MIKKLDLTDIKTAKSVLELQKAAYRVEAELIGFFEIPPLKDTQGSLASSGETFYGYFTDGELAGIISYKTAGAVLDIHRVAVHPGFFRRGAANKLLRFIEGAENGIGRVTVRTGKENLPAVSLYIKNGFRPVRDIPIGRGVYLTEFEKVF
jgi:ribosomal protein S18 acetylase RimI-like enzyme